MKLYKFTSRNGVFQAPNYYQSVIATSIEEAERQLDHQFSWTLFTITK